MHSHSLFQTLHFSSNGGSDGSSDTAIKYKTSVVVRHPARVSTARLLVKNKGFDLVSSSAPRHYTVSTTSNMPMPGYVFKDGGPIPDSDLKDPQNPANFQAGATPIMERVDEQPISRTRTSASNISSNSNSVASIMNTPTSSASASNAPSDSHALASADDHEVKGAVQTNHEDGEVRDMGWNDHPHDVPAPLVGGLPNEELWTLVRRFNKQMYHVKATNAAMIGGLDCYIVDEDEFSPDKLRSNIERLYMTVIIGMMGFGKHVARLRSWREPRRTGAFCAVRLHVVSIY